MATKKKTAKPVKKSSSKKPTPPPQKKAPAKPGKPLADKTVKKHVAKALAPKKAAPAPKKLAAKPVVAKKPEPAHGVAKKPEPTHHVAKTTHSTAKKEPVKKQASPVIKAPEKKQETARPSIPLPLKTHPQKVVAPERPTKVVMPEIKTKTVRKYEPEFTKSVLDSAQIESNNNNNGPIMRYTDVELAEFKELITKKLDAAKKELAYLQGLITRKDEMGGDNDDARYMTMEDGSMSMEREQLSQMASRQITFIDHLEKALMRIENKTYGICRITGKLIDKARLRAVPHATLSIEAKQLMNK
jgi:RNA polymerase-binding transcription factor DksA